MSNNNSEPSSQDRQLGSPANTTNNDFQHHLQHQQHQRGHGRRPLTLKDYYRSNRRMRHRQVFLCCPPLWLIVGHMYREWDALAGVLFILGSLGFALVPIFRAYEISSPTELNISMMVSVALFLLAKVVLELRAIYAVLWKRPTKRPSGLYHLAIVTLIPAGILFFLVPALKLSNDLHLAAAEGWCAFFSGWLFLVGTTVFTFDGVTHLEKPYCAKITNTYFWGSFALMLGSALFVYTGFCESPISSKFNVNFKDGFHYQGETCSAFTVNWINGVGGILFVVGSVLFLIFAIDETKQMRNGPDPRLMNFSDYGDDDDDEGNDNNGDDGNDDDADDDDKDNNDGDVEEQRDVEETFPEQNYGER